MKRFFLFFFSFLMLRVVDDAGAVVDRGDDFVPTDDDPAVAKALLEKGEAESQAAAQAALDQAAADKEEAAAKAKLKADGKDDPDDEDDPDDDEATKAVKAAAKAGKKDSRIPLARHEAVLTKERAARAELEAKLAKYEGGERVAVTNADIAKAETQLETMEKDYSKLLVDGDHAKAAELMTKMRRLDRDISDKKLEVVSAAAQANAIEQVRYDTTVERIEAAYPALNPDDKDSYDADMVKKVTRYAGALRAEGFTPAQALQTAAQDILGTATKKQEAATTVVARVDEDDVAKKLAAERKAAQLKKNLETNKAQPNALAKAGADSDKAGGTISAKDVMKMTQEDFSKLDEETLARMRGDALA